MGDSVNSQLYKYLFTVYVAEYSDITDESIVALNHLYHAFALVGTSLNSSTENFADFIPKTYQQAISCKFKDVWIEAMEKEFWIARSEQYMNSSPLPAER
mgnify:CR=1 FL=1